MESQHKREFEVNNEINSKVSLCQRGITKINIDAIVNVANETLIGGGGIDGAIHEAAESALSGKCRKLNNYETGECER